MTARSRTIWHASALLLISAVSLFAYLPGASQPSLFEDEWAAARLMAYDQQACPDSGSVFLRPLRGCFRLLQHRVFGLDIQAFHYTTLLLRTVVALLFYALLSCLAPEWPLFNTIAALLFTVYPTSFFYPFFEGNYQYVSCALFLGGAIALYAGTASENWAFLAAGLALMALSLLFYESVMGLMLGLALLLLIRFRERSLTLFVASGLSILLVLAFLGGRWFVQLNAGQAFGHDTGSLVARLSPTQLALDLARGYWISLIRGWTDAFLSLFRVQGNPPYRELFWPLFVPAVLAAFGLAAFVLRRSRKQQAAPSPGSVQQTISRVASSPRLSIAFIGLFAIGFGYFPSIIALSPGLNYSSGRSNYLPAMGAAAFITLLLWALASRLKPKKKPVQMAFIGLAAPLIVLGILTHRFAQQETNVSWQIQKNFWQAVFTQAPDWDPGTSIILTLPKASKRPLKYGAAPFSIYRDAFSGAMGMLYGKNEPIEVTSVYDMDHRDLQTTPDGFSLQLPYSTQRVVVPYQQAIILNYDEEASKLDVISAFEVKQRDGTTEGQPLCTACVRATPAQHTEWRILVK